MASEIWFTSDTHFHHRNLMQHYAHRSVFADEVEMTEFQITLWNSLIKPKDIVYHIGDFGAYHHADSIAVVKRLNGRKHLVPGNHDIKLIKQAEFTRHWTEVFPYSYKEISVDKQKIILCHYPIWEWNQLHRGSWHLHGHLHGKPHGIPGKILDVGVDGNALRPYNLSDVREFMETRPVRYHHAPEEM